jgi:mRNA interferase MazF
MKSNHNTHRRVVGYDKDFDSWNEVKKNADSQSRFPEFSEGQIWWCKIGLNVGFEQDGKGGDYLRPVYIAKKCNREVFFGIVLTSQKKIGKYYLDLGKLDGKSSSVLILSQARLFSAKRLSHFMHKLSYNKQVEINEKFYETMLQKKFTPSQGGVAPNGDLYPNYSKVELKSQAIKAKEER